MFVKVNLIEEYNYAKMYHFDRIGSYQIIIFEIIDQD